MFHRIISNMLFNASTHHDTSYFILKIILNISQETHFIKDNNGCFPWVLLNANLLNTEEEEERERERECM
jgi:hypothetical protein